MGNRQTSNAALIIQYPNGTAKRINWSVTAGEVMQLNPGHFVSIIMQMNQQHNPNSANHDESTVFSFTRAKLLRPHESLILGNVYRLLTTEEVMKVMRAKRYGKMKNNNNQSGGINYRSKGDMEKQGLLHLDQETKFAAARTKSWRPSLHSISEAGI